MLNRLAPIPRTTYNGQQVFALGDPGTLSDGRAIRPGDNTVNLEFVHPGEALGINGPAADRQVAIQTLDAMNSWGQDNSFPKVFTQAARVGYPAQSLIDKLKTQIGNRSAANLRVTDPHHGLEKSGDRRGDQQHAAPERPGDHAGLPGVAVGQERLVRAAAGAGRVRRLLGAGQRAGELRRRDEHGRRAAPAAEPVAGPRRHRHRRRVAVGEQRCHHFLHRCGGRRTRSHPTRSPERPVTTSGRPFLSAKTTN